MHPALHSIQADVVRADRIRDARLARSFAADGSDWLASGVPESGRSETGPTDSVRRRR